MPSKHIPVLVNSYVIKYVVQHYSQAKSPKWKEPLVCIDYNAENMAKKISMTDGNRTLVFKLVAQSQYKLGYKNFKKQLQLSSFYSNVNCYF